MRRFVFLMSVSLVAFSAANLQAQDMGYLPPPTPMDYQRTLATVQQLPAFQQQAAYASYEQAGAYASPYAASQGNIGQSEIHYATNYQVPAIPAYLPVSRMAAQQAASAVYTGQQANYGSYQQAGFITQGQPTAVPQPQQMQPQMAQAGGAMQQPLLSSEPMPMQASAQPMMQQAPSYQQPYAYQQPVSQPMMQQPSMPMPVAAPQPLYAPAPQTSMAYNPPTMDGNPRYDSVPPAQEPSFAMDYGWRNVGFYGALRSALNFAEDTSFKNAAGTYTNEYHTGYGFSGAAGYAFSPWARWVAPRLEAEFGTQNQSIDKHKLGVLTFTDPAAYGETSTLYGLVNGYLDFAPIMGVVEPYLGGGFGFGIVDFDRHGVTVPVMANEDVGLAYQVGAGLGIRVGSGTYLDVGYRYFQVPDLELTARDGTVSTTDLGEHSITFGVRQSF